MKFWLFKTEPNVFSIDDLENSHNQECEWEGVRNYQARNFLRDEVQKNDLVLFYHSRQNPPEIVAIVEVSKDSYPDFHAFDKKSEYYDTKSNPENPIWYMVNVKLKFRFNQSLTTNQMRNYKELSEMMVLRKGSRLSIQPVTKTEFSFILSLYNLEIKDIIDL